LATGKLYRQDNEEFVAEVNYKFHDDSPRSWWGELILNEYKRIGDNGHFIIEFEDKRRGRCHLKKRVNRAVSGVPPRYIYYFNGTSVLE